MSAISSRNRFLNFLLVVENLSKHAVVNGNRLLCGLPLDLEMNVI